MISPEMLAKSGTEEAEQAALFQWAALQRLPELRLMFAVPNGGKRDKITAARLKATGVKAGVPDVMLPIARNGYNGLFLELKRGVSYKVGKRGAPIIDKAAGVASNAQEGWHDALRRQGYYVAVCEGWRASAVQINAYLTGEGALVG